MGSKPSYGELEAQLKILTETLESSELDWQQNQQLLQEKINRLEQSQTLFEAAFDQAPFPIAFVGVEGNVMAMNRVCIETIDNTDIHIGTNISNLEGLWKYEDADGNIIPFNELPLINAIKGKGTKNKEIKVTGRKGGEGWEIVTSSPIYDMENRQIAAFFTFPDITERIKAKEKLIESETQYRNLFNNAGISIWNEDLSDIYSELEQLRKGGITDLKAYLKDKPQLVLKLVSKVKVINVNDATYKLFGVSPEINLVEKIAGFFGADAITVFTEQLYAIWDKKAFYSSEANFITAEGKEIKAILSFIIPVNAEDFASIAITIQDITELDYQQDRLNAVVDALPDITFILDEDGKYIEILTSCHDLLYDELQKLKGDYIHNILPQTDADFIVNTIRQSIEAGEKMIVEYELDVPHGRVWFEGRVSPMQNTFSGKHAVVWIAIDITEHKKTETQLRQAQKMEAIGILTGGIAHEFNNLLSPILGYTELFLSDKPENDLEYCGLEQILIAGNRAKVLVQQLLAYGRQSMSQRESICLETVVEDTYKLIQNTIPSNITIKKNIQVNLPYIYGMPNEIHQVILNLCVNATHSMPEGGDLFLILQRQNPIKTDNSKLVTSENDYICLTVQDTGQGITASIIDRIFDPFFTTKDIGQGSGLGLSVVQGIVEQHKGLIEIDSKIDVGSAFHVYFPVSDTKSESVEVKNTPLLQGDEHILLVDDEQMIVDISKSMLEKLNYKVTAFIDSEAALQHFSAHNRDFDLIMTDYGMPKMDGKQFVQKLKAIRADIPVILFTGYGDFVAKENIEQWGMDELLIKPFAFKEISEMIRNVLSK